MIISKTTDVSPESDKIQNFLTLFQALKHNGIFVFWNSGPIGHMLPLIYGH